MWIRGRAARALRDRHGAARAIAYLTLAGAPYVLVTGLIDPGITPTGMAGVALAAAFMTLTGVLCLRRPGILPPLFWYAAPVVAVALVTGLNLGTRDASTGAQLFYLWPVLYAANFLPRRVSQAVLGLVLAGHLAVVVTVLGLTHGLADWVAMALAMTMTEVVVGGLRDRADKLRAVLQQQANADPLTGLDNRRSFTSSLTEAGDWARRTGGTLALVTIDLDHFKDINDTYGHAEGDRALRAVADALRTVAGDDGIAARLGGDEFVLLLRSPPATTVDRLRALVAATPDLPGGPPGLSIGVATLPGDVATVEELMTASDAAMYSAKAGSGLQNVDAVPEAAAPRLSR